MEGSRCCLQAAAPSFGQSPFSRCAGSRNLERLLVHTLQWIFDTQQQPPSARRVYLRSLTRAKTY
eukprot:6206425-Pleurochrysis_carterae.AAC.2